ncbi:substrate-binding domain-containing protein [Secundilactobacillus oryzae]|uniref:substrate-binding domain-containing protein n=1 Tax=Secundilactobacillus oryzae TaxID=1202668 RepID=UPI000AF347E4
MLFDVDADIEREERLLKAIGEQNFDGLILQPFSDPQKIRNLIRRDIPIVIVDREMDPNPWPQVVTDNYEAARQATQYYSDKGFTHVIVMSSEIEAARTREERYKGIKSVGNKVNVVEVPEKSYNHAEIDKKNCLS